MNRPVRSAAALVSLMLLPSAAAAELRHVRISVAGFEWASCARAVSAAIKKIEGVDSVEVSTETSSVDIRLKADNKVTLPQLRRTVRSTGNEPKDALITGRGRIVDREGTPILDLLNGATMEVESGPKAAPDGVVDITGVSKERSRDVERVTITKIK